MTDRKLTPPGEWAEQHDWGDCELGPDCGCCKELRERMIKIIAAAVLEARLYQAEMDARECERERFAGNHLFFTSLIRALAKDLEVDNAD